MTEAVEATFKMRKAAETALYDAGLPSDIRLPFAAVSRVFPLSTAKTAVRVCQAAEDVPRLAADEVLSFAAAASVFRLSLPEAALALLAAAFVTA